MSVIMFLRWLNNNWWQRALIVAQSHKNHVDTSEQTFLVDSGVGVHPNDKLTVNSILYKTGNLRRCSHNFMKNFNSVGASGIVCDRGLFSSEMVQTFIVLFMCHKKVSERGKINFHFYSVGSPLTDSLTLSTEAWRNNKKEIMNFHNNREWQRWNASYREIKLNEISSKTNATGLC